MKKYLKYLAPFIFLIIILYQHQEINQFKIAFNQSLKLYLEAAKVLVNSNLSYLDKFDKEGYLSEKDYLTMIDNQSFTIVIFQNMESLDQLMPKLNEQYNGFKRSLQSSEMNDRYYDFEYEKNRYKDATDEILRRYYTKLDNELSTLLEKSDSIDWYKEVRLFLYSGSTHFPSEE
ncbi:hypothetical protein [Fusibacter ferrireducens]|uniref:Uncharacterized protein n=1 Tax=Fusibacter ferrireducens TaxID=2785058 RepID=A0ABR9ZSG9_9FIRM|nr:hypothetical protein [Fusibacter ferrireducens]MBF4693395.1 hypothetical protein [Fusibacter ferrireducens]